MWDWSAWRPDAIPDLGVSRGDGYFVIASRFVSFYGLIISSAVFAHILLTERWRGRSNQPALSR